MKSPWARVFDLTIVGRNALLRRVRAGGKPVPLPVWEHEYRSGIWDRLHDGRELPRYMVISGYIANAPCKARILDVGCGDGWLPRLLPTCAYQNYIGIDFCTEAIARAKRSAREQDAFLVADFEAWRPRESMDIIVFNESLYYSSEPVHLVSCYSEFLEPGGRILISMFKPSSSRRVWKRLDKLFDRVDGATVTHFGGDSWEIAVYVPRPEPKELTA